MYAHLPEWYRNFEYEAERDRGLDYSEDLAAPGIFTWDISGGEAVLILAAARDDGDLSDAESATAAARRWRATEKSRRAGSRLLRSADAYVVERAGGKTIIAGYPWFTDWGRDTFIAVRGQHLATGRLADARAILLQWANTVSAGMLPNRFPDSGESPEYNAVDRSLWFVIAVHDFLDAAATRGWPVPTSDWNPCAPRSTRSSTATCRERDTTSDVALTACWRLANQACS